MARLSLIPILVAWLLLAPAAPAETITLRLADGIPAGHIIDKTVIEPFIKAVTEASGGQIEIQHFPAEQLGKSRDLLTLTQAGVADIGFIVPSYMSDRMPLTTATDLPGLFKDSCQGSAAFHALTRAGAILDEKEFKLNGIKPLITFLMPPFQLILSSPHRLSGVHDVQGLKIRSAGGATDLLATGIGAVPIHVGPPEIYEAMSRGTLDGALLLYQSAVSYHLAGVLKSGTVAEDFGTVAITFSMRIEKWNSLPANVQAILTEAGEKVSATACGLFNQAEASAIDKIHAAGVRLVQPDPADRPNLEAAFVAIRRDWADRLDRRGKPGSEILAAFTEAAAKADAQ